jgi:hypothetical protein
MLWPPEGIGIYLIGISEFAEFINFFAELFANRSFTEAIIINLVAV